MLLSATAVRNEVETNATAPASPSPKRSVMRRRSVSIEMAGIGEATKVDWYGGNAGALQKHIVRPQSRQFPLPQLVQLTRRRCGQLRATSGHPVLVLTRDAFSWHSLPRVRRESVADMVGSEPAI